jgi:hypothetical protein
MATVPCCTVTKQAKSVKIPTMIKTIINPDAIPILIWFNVSNE